MQRSLGPASPCTTGGIPHKDAEEDERRERSRATILQPSGDWRASD